MSTASKKLPGAGWAGWPPLPRVPSPFPPPPVLMGPPIAPSSPNLEISAQRAAAGGLADAAAAAAVVFTAVDGESERKDDWKLSGGWERGGTPEEGGVVGCFCSCELIALVLCVRCVFCGEKWAKYT